MNLLALIGWSGTLLYLLNHAYISLAPNWKSTIYYGGNLIAALCLVLTSAVAQSWQAVVINSFWAIISVLLLANISLKNAPFTQPLFNSGIALLWLSLIIAALLTYAFHVAML